MKIRTLTIASVLALLALLAGVAQPTLAQPAQIPARSTTYVVQAGDSWATISKKYGVSASRLIDLNNLRKTPDLLLIGQKIIIPIDLGATPSYISPFLYTVKAGDTVAGLVSKFYIDKTALLQANRLPTNAATLTAGATLLIPAGPHRYVVQKGDTINTIAALFSTTTNGLLKYNPHLGAGSPIYPGNNVYVPIQYDVTFSPAPVEGTGGGGEGAVGGSAATSTTGLPATSANAAALAQAANASVINVFQTITMPGNVVNLGQPLQMRWYRLNGVRRDTTRENGAIATVVLVFRGGNGAYTLKHYVTENGTTTLKGMAFQGIYVNPENSDLWSEIQFDVQTTCNSTIADSPIFSTGATTFETRYEYNDAQMQCPAK